ncbi:MAG: DUF494 domain-containing protein [Gammaproteobacteria bacterium]|nr:DUF494 domain-containing protein [Gammaproteobacteria bacterium]
MKQTVLDVLLYLFEHCVEEDVDVVVDREALQSDLRRAGFDEIQVGKAFDWLHGLATHKDDAAVVPLSAPGSFRVFTSGESAKLDVDCRGFLLFLEQIKVLDSASRELVIDRLMALEADEIDLEQLKWVVLMVLFNQPGQDEAFMWMEDLVMDEVGRSLH